MKFKGSDLFKKMGFTFFREPDSHAAARPTDPDVRKREIEKPFAAPKG